MLACIFAQPRKGKTSLKAHLQSEYLYGAKAIELTQQCKQEILKLNNKTTTYTPPPRSPVFADFEVKVINGHKSYAKNFFVSGFRLGLANDKVQVINIPPCSMVFLTEVQRYFNSRKVGDFPNWILRYYEMHGHWKLNAYFDTQRPMLIDKAIRENINKFMYIENLEHTPDSRGNIEMSHWTVYTFKRYEDYETYISTSEQSPDHYKYEIEHHYHMGNIFDTYDSYNCRHNFAPKSKIQILDKHSKPKSHLDEIINPTDFNYIEHIGNPSNSYELMLSQEMYSSTEPEGYFKK